jgi:hypothetical protein
MTEKPTKNLWRYPDEILGDWDKPNNRVFVDAITKWQQEIVKVIVSQRVSLTADQVSEMCRKPLPAGPYVIGQRVRINASFTNQTAGVIAELNAQGARIDGLWFGWYELSPETPSLPTGHPAPGSTGLRLNEEQREALSLEEVPFSSTSGPWVDGSDERTGPYGGDDLGHEAVVAALTVALPANIEARKRNVAALAAELRKPFEPRFPPEGRSDRVYGGRRW